MINLYWFDSKEETDAWRRIDIPEERRQALGYYWHDGVRPVQGRDYARPRHPLSLTPSLPNPV